MADLEQIAQQQELYLSLLPEVRERYGNIKGVDVIGLGAKERSGQPSDEWAWRFYVRAKRALHELPLHEQIPAEIFGVQTDVIVHLEHNDLVCDASSLPANTLINDDAEYRDLGGIFGGAPIRNEYFKSDTNSGYGTLGMLVRRISDKKLMGLTCAHVVNAAADSMTATGVHIGQPRYWVSCCCCPKGSIGPVVAASHYSNAATPNLDCALIEIDDDIRKKAKANVADDVPADFPLAQTLENKILGHSVLTGADDAAKKAFVESNAITVTGARSVMCFDDVVKRGRGTGHTTGKVVDVAFGTDQMMIKRTGTDADTAPFACHGDSGAMIINPNDRKVLGMIVAGLMETYEDAGVQKKRLTHTIATHIKPIMQHLGIKIGGSMVDAAMGDPVGGGVNGCEIKIWPGGHTDSALNPPETFDSTHFYPVGGNINWEVLAGPGGALIVEKDGTPINPGVATVTNAAQIKVRYGSVSTSSGTSDAVQVKGTRGSERPATVFRTVFKITPRPINVAGSLHAANQKRFLGTTTTAAGAEYPATAGITHYLAKAEIIYDVLPADVDWNGGILAFVNSNAGGALGNIRPFRETKFGRGEQGTAAANRTHTDQPGWIAAGDSSNDDFQPPAAATRALIFRLANKGFNPLIESQDINNDTYNPAAYFQRYVRAHYRDRMEFFNGTTWVPLTADTEWSVNFTGTLSVATPHTAPPVPGAATDNILAAGLNADPLPNTQPTITISTADPLEVRLGQTNVTLTAVPVDADNDALTATAPPPPPAATPFVKWTQTNHLGALLALTANPAHPDTSVRFTAPAVDGQFIFSAETNDNTAGLSRAPAVPLAPAIPNYQSDHPTIRVNVIEWLFRLGGYPDTVDNQTEEFHSSDFGFAAGTLVAWDVTLGNTDAVIISQNGAAIAAVGSVASAHTIIVRYDNACADQTIGNTVKIQATHGTTWFKRRTIIMAEWAAWPGGQGTTALNPTEAFTAADMGFAGGTLLNWDVSPGNPNGVITVGGAGTVANGVASITVRFDTQSPTITVADAVWIQATNPANGQVAIKARTVFVVTPQAINTTNALDGNDALRFTAAMGTTTQAETVDTSMPGVSRTGSKVEQIWDILPQNIPWNRRTVSFVFEQNAFGVILVNNSKFQFKCRREAIRVGIAQITMGSQRDFIGTAQDPPVNDPGWTVDGFSDPGDCQYPTNALPNRIYRIDVPGGPDVPQLVMKADFREYAEFHNGTGWSRITPYSLWFFNAELILPILPAVFPIVGGTNNSGAGAGAVIVTNTSPVINAGADQVVAAGSVVVLTAVVTDANIDVINNVQWTQVAGPAVALAPVDALGLSQTFVAPAGPTRLTFNVFAEDFTVLCNFYNPGNARSNTDSVNIDIN